ncbi:MAG: MFS transporter [Rickettsiales bacterium]
MNRFTFILTLLSITAHYYDYHIIGHLAVQISENFFLETDPISGMIKTYAIIYLSMLAKPLGAFIFGKISDIKGRQVVIKIGLIITALASICIACIPSYSSIGILATILLLICRIIIATTTSSSADAIRIYLYERQKERPYFSIGISSLFSVLGTLIASFSVYIFTLKSLPSYAWRFSILLGGAFSLIIYFIYYFYSDKLDNINYVKQSKDYVKTQNLTTYEVIKENKLKFILVAIATGCIGALFHFHCIFWGNYNCSIPTLVSDIKKYIPIAILIYIIGLLFFSYLSDIFKPKRIFQISICFTTILYICLGFNLFNKTLHLAFYIIASFFIGGSLVSSLAIITKAVEMNIRNRLIGFAHSFGSIFLSNSMSIIILFLYKLTNICEVSIIYALFLVFALFVVSIKLDNLESAK